MKSRILCSILVSALLLAASSMVLADPSIVATFNGPLAADCRWPASVIADPAGHGWLVASTANSSIVRLDPSGVPVGALALPSPPSWLGLTTRGDRVLALSLEGNSLYQIDPVAWRIERSATTGANPIAAIQCGAYTYVANAGDSTLSRFVGPQLYSGGTIDLPEEPSCVAFNAWYNALLVGGAETGTVYRIAPSTGRVLWSVKTGSLPVAICADWKLPWALVVDQLDGTVVPLRLSQTPGLKMSALPVGDCPMAAVQDKVSAVVYVTCNTSPSASIWRVDANSLTTTKLAEMPYGPDPASIAIREYAGQLCAVSRCRNAVSLVSLADSSVSTVPIAYILRDISGSAGLGQVYTAYSSTVPYPKGTPSGLISVYNSGSLVPDSVFSSVSPAAIAPWVGGSKLVVGGVEGYLAEYDLPGGALFGGVPLPLSRFQPGAMGLCVAENFPKTGATAFICTSAGSGYMVNLAQASTTTATGLLAYTGWLGYDEPDARLLGVYPSSSYPQSFAFSNPPGSTYLMSIGNIYVAPVRPSNPGTDSLVYLPGTASGGPSNPPYYGSRVTALSGPFGLTLTNSPTFRVCRYANVPDRNPVAAARNDLNGHVYVANYSDATVGVFDGALNRLATVPVGGRPFRIWCDSAANLVYVGDYDSNKVTVIEDIATVPTLDVAGAVAAQYGTMACVTGGVVKTLPLMQGKTGYEWYHFDIEMPDHSAQITHLRKALPDVRIGQQVDMTGSIQPIRIGTATTSTKSIVPREMVVH